MGMGGGGSNSGMKAEPNVIPLTDILLVLLIIFMVITPMLKKGVDVKLPEASQITKQPGEGIATVSIRKDGRVYFNSTLLDDPDKLTEKLTSYVEEKNKTKIFFKADEDVEYGEVVKLIQKIKDAGIEVVGLITEKKTGTLH